MRARPGRLLSRVAQRVHWAPDGGGPGPLGAALELGALGRVPAPRGLHSTWLVNSATHLWGPRRFDIRDDSRNTWWVAILTFGEGWHNNHHAHPNSARHGLAWI